MAAKRNSKGHYLPGTEGGPGRPPRQTEDSYVRLLADVVTPNEWMKVCKKALVDAKKGNSYARSWISDYLVGKPKQVLTLESNEVLILAQVLEQFKAMGLEPGDVFQAMLSDVVSEDMMIEG